MGAAPRSSSQGLRPPPGEPRPPPAPTGPCRRSHSAPGEPCLPSQVLPPPWPDWPQHPGPKAQVPSRCLLSDPTPPCLGCCLPPRSGHPPCFWSCPETAPHATPLSREGGRGSYEVRLPSRPHRQLAVDLGVPSPHCPKGASGKSRAARESPSTPHGDPAGTGVPRQPQQSRKGREHLFI